MWCFPLYTGLPGFDLTTSATSLARGHMGGGGATWGTRSWDPGTPPWARGSIYKKKVLQDPGPNTHRATTIRKEVLTPPTPHPQKRGTQVRGGTGVKIEKKIIGDHFWSQNDAFTRG